MDKTRSFPLNTVMTRTLILDHLEMKRKWWRRKKGLNLGAEEEADAKSFMWQDADRRQEKEILSAHWAGVGSVQGSSDPQMFRMSLTLAPALTAAWVVSDVYAVSERRWVLHK